MKMLTKKSIAGLVAGTFLFAGAVVPFAVHAAQTTDNPRSAMHDKKMAPPKLDPQKMAAEMSQSFGIDQETLAKYTQKGVDFRDLHRGAFLSLASGKSLDEVMSMKTDTNTWQDIAQTLGIQKEQVKAAHQTVIANRLHAKLDMNKDAVLALAQNGYKARDIAMANLLAANSDKSIQDVLDMKKINNTWKNVANNLGVDQATFKSDSQKVRQALGGGFGHRHGHGPGGPGPRAPQDAATASSK